MGWNVKMLEEYEEWFEELRTKHKNIPYRSLYVFDPKQEAILLLGGDKSSEKKWYKRNIPRAEKRYEKYLRKLKKEN